MCEKPPRNHQCSSLLTRFFTLRRVPVYAASQAAMSVSNARET